MVILATTCVFKIFLWLIFLGHVPQKLSENCRTRTIYWSASNQQLESSEVDKNLDLIEMMTDAVCVDGNWVILSRDHSFPQNAEFWADPWNLPVST